MPRNIRISSRCTVHSAHYILHTEYQISFSLLNWTNESIADVIIWIGSMLSQVLFKMSFVSIDVIFFFLPSSLHFTCLSNNLIKCICHNLRKNKFNRILLTFCIIITLYIRHSNVKYAWFFLVFFGKSSIKIR